MGLDETYEGVGDEVDGEVFNQEADGDMRPFTANLDVGIKSTTTGARVFAALMGAVDGGLNVPHSEKRFVGYDREEKKYNAEDMKDRIFGEHVAEYMRYLMEDVDKPRRTSPSSSRRRSRPQLRGPPRLRARGDPRGPAARGEGGGRRGPRTYKRPAKKTYEERKAAVEEKKAAMMEEDDDDDGTTATSRRRRHDDDEEKPLPAKADYQGVQTRIPRDATRASAHDARPRLGVAVR